MQGMRRPETENLRLSGEYSHKRYMLPEAVFPTYRSNKFGMNIQPKNKLGLSEETMQASKSQPETPTNHNMKKPLISFFLSIILSHQVVKEEK